jgi:hypothetical protein
MGGGPLRGGRPLYSLLDCLGSQPAATPQLDRVAADRYAGRVSPGADSCECLCLPETTEWIGSGRPVAGARPISSCERSLQVSVCTGRGGGEPEEGPRVWGWAAFSRSRYGAGTGSREPAGSGSMTFPGATNGSVPARFQGTGNMAGSRCSPPRVSLATRKGPGVGHEDGTTRVDVVTVARCCSSSPCSVRDG